MPNPHGGKLVSRNLKGERTRKILEESSEFEVKLITSDLAKDVENIAHGVFSPLEGFLVQEDYSSVLFEKRLADNTPWTVPLVIDASDEEIKKIREGEYILLAHKTSVIAVMHVEDVYTYDKKQFAQKVFGTTDCSHPGVSKVYHMNPYFLGGKIDLICETEIQPQIHPYRLTPRETRQLFKKKKWKTVAGFQTRNIPHAGHEYMQEKAFTMVDGIFINPVTGTKKLGDFTDEAILETYKMLINTMYLKEKAVMGILQTEMRYAGPREAIFHAIIRKNFGCTHFIVGRDHAGVNNYYHPYAAQKVFEEFPDLGITPIFFKSFFYCKKCGAVTTEETCPHPKDYHIEVSGTKIREMLARGVTPPKEVLRPEIAEIISRKHELFIT